MKATDSIVTGVYVPDSTKQNRNVACWRARMLICANLPSTPVFDESHGRYCVVLVTTRSSATPSTSGATPVYLWAGIERGTRECEGVRLRECGTEALGGNGAPDLVRVVEAGAEPAEVVACVVTGRASVEAAV